jgi:hypothetical protein
MDSLPKTQTFISTVLEAWKAKQKVLAEQMSREGPRTLLKMTISLQCLHMVERQEKEGCFVIVCHGTASICEGSLMTHFLIALPPIPITFGN